MTTCPTGLSTHGPWGSAQDSTMYAFATGVSTAMLSGIGVAIGIMVLMTASALFYRSAMGGKKDFRGCWKK